MSVINLEEYNTRIHALVPIAAHLNIRVVRFGDGEADLVMPFGPHLSRPVDVVSGPALMSLADISAAAAVATAVEDYMTVFTADLHMRFLYKAVGCDVKAHARVLRIGKTLSTSEVEMRDAVTGGLVAHATASFAVHKKQ